MDYSTQLIDGLYRYQYRTSKVPVQGGDDRPFITWVEVLKNRVTRVPSPTLLLIMAII